VSIDLCKDDRHLQHFYRLYKSTMRRNNASEWYYFSPDFWNESFTLLDDKITLFCAGYNNTIIAAASFLHEGETVHYFLGGSDSNYLALRPNNLLMYQAILWAKSQGYKFFNLGGAYGDNDDLARFKAAFSKLTITFYTYRMIHNKSVYDELCQNHQAYYLMLGQQACNTNFFPQYRTEN